MLIVFQTKPVAADYEKQIHKLYMQDESIRWGWPNDGQFIDIGFNQERQGETIPLQEVTRHEIAEDEFFRLQEVFFARERPTKTIERVRTSVKSRSIHPRSKY